MGSKFLICAILKELEGPFLTVIGERLVIFVDLESEVRKRQIIKAVIVTIAALLHKPLVSELTDNL